MVDIAKWPTTPGEHRAPHPWTVAIASKAAPWKPTSPEILSAMLFESVRGELTYREISAVFNQHFTAGYINSMALRHGFIRHRNPTIHVGKTFGLTFAR